MLSVPQPAFSNSSDLKSVFEGKFLRIRIGGRLYGRNKVACSNFSGVLWTGPKTNLEHIGVQPKIQIGLHVSMCSNVAFHKYE